MSLTSRRQKKVTVAMSDNGLPSKPPQSRRSLFRRFFDLDYPPEAPQESSASGIWASNASISASRKPKDGKRKTPHHSKSMSNLSNAFDSHARSASQATALNDPASQSDSQLLTNPQQSRRNRMKAKQPDSSQAPSVAPSTIPNSPPVPSFELTPLSGLIKQSYKDIETLKNAHNSVGRARGKVRLGEEAASVSAAESLGLGMVGGGRRIDFEKVEENLRRFEEVYRSFLRYGGAHGDSQEEVHLVAMVCKRSEVINGTMGSSESVPVAKVPDCGL